MRSRLLVGVALISIMGALAGCSTTNLRDKADQAQRASDKITTVLTDYDAGRIEDSDLARAIVASLPPDWQARAQTVLEGIGDVRAGGGELAARLDELAASLSAQADKDESDTKNAVFGVISVADALIGTNGLLAIIAGIFWKRKRDAESTTEDIVTSFQAGKGADPAMQAAFDGHGGSVVQTSMKPSTQAAVNKIIKKTT